MMGEIVPATRERLVDLFQGVAQQDTDAVRCRCRCRWRLRRRCCCL